MYVRGHRRCTECGREWSYFDTGRIDCPDCGNLQSVGQGARTRHTDSPVSLDLSPHRSDLESDTDLGEIAPDLKATLRDYIRQRGFIREGEIQPVDDTVLAAAELLHAVDIFDRTRTPDDDERLYVLELLRGADSGERPDPSAVSPSMTDARGLAYAEVLDQFCTDLRTWLDDNPDPDGRRLRESLDTHVTRIEAVYGDVPVRESEAVVRAAREAVAYLVDDDESALVRARDRLSRLE
jgi:hypothetical protein